MSKERKKKKKSKPVIIIAEKNEILLLCDFAVLIIFIFLRCILADILKQ